MKFLWLAAALAAASSAVADETSDSVKTALARSRGAVHTLKSVVALEFQGRSMDAKVETTALVLDASGLLVAPNPEDLMQGLPPGCGVSTKSFLLVTSEGKELEARTVGRDAEFGLLFLRLTEKDAPALPALPAAQAAPLELGDPLLLVGQLSSRHQEPICVTTRVSSVIQKPRRMYLTSEGLGLGIVALAPNGDPVGLTARVKEKDPDSEKENAILVVLPMAQVTEAAKAVHEEKPAEKPEAQPDEKPSEKPGKGEPGK